MRLINVHTRLLEEFIGEQVPEYAILSHTWEEEEITYSHYIKGDFENMKGNYKIDMTCRTAKERHLSYAWVDTCCIDKSSSAELSEAINSMYRWYEGAVECYVYLLDLKPGMDWMESLRRCRWFTRGWTLQELIASQHMIFFDSAWSSSGRPRGRTKSRLAGLLSDITGVNHLLLSNQRSVQDPMYSVAQKMSWAACRETTRVEDKAYCLLGLFNINMPLLYGEGGKAFIRLQEEIMRSNADLSIFAWYLPCKDQSHITKPGPTGEDELNLLSGVLAESPADFKYAGGILNVASRHAQEFSTTNIGIKTRTRIYFDRDKKTLVMPLHCVMGESSHVLAICLMHLRNQRYLRRDSFSVYAYNRIESLPMEPLLERYLLPNHSIESQSHERWASWSKVKLRTRSACLQIVTSDGAQLRDPWPAEWYDIADQSFFVEHDPGRDMCCVETYISLPNDEGCRVSLIALGWSDGYGDPQFGILKSNDYTEYLEQLQDKACKADYIRTQFVLDLILCGIPRVRSLHHLLSETEEIAIIRAHPRKRPADAWSGPDPPGWEVSFSTDVYPVGKAPAIQSSRWRLED